MDSDSVFQSGVRIPISIPISNLSNSWVPEYAEGHLQSCSPGNSKHVLCVRHHFKYKIFSGEQERVPDFCGELRGAVTLDK